MVDEKITDFGLARFAVPRMACEVSTLDNHESPFPTTSLRESYHSIDRSLVEVANMMRRSSRPRLAREFRRGICRPASNRHPRAANEESITASFSFRIQPRRICGRGGAHRVRASFVV